MKMTGIYKITSPSGKVYIGQSRNIKNRWRDHKTSRFAYCRYVNNSIKKYGAENHVFEMLHELPNNVSRQIMNEYELFYWQQYKDAGFRMLNIMKPGNSVEHSEETKKKISEAGKGRKSSQLAIELLRQRSIGNKYSLGLKHSEESKIKMSKWQKGKPHSISHNDKIRLANLGRKQSSETIEKRRLKLVGHKVSEETRLKISKGNTNNPVHSKPVIQMNMSGEFIKEWQSISEAARCLNMFDTNIGNVLLGIGGRKTAGGFKWQYKNTV